MVANKQKVIENDLHNDVDLDSGEVIAHEEHVDSIIDLVDIQDDEGILDYIKDKTEGQIADIIESLPHDQREWVWQVIPEDCQVDVLENLSDGVRNHLLESLSKDEVVAAVSDMDHGELVDVLDNASDELSKIILHSMDSKGREAIETRMAYPEESAGRYMSGEWTAIRSDVTLEVVNRYLKRQDSLPPHTDGLLVVDRDGIYLGKLPLGVLLTHHDEMLVADAMTVNADVVNVTIPSDEFANLFEYNEVSSLAVVDDEHHLIGRITIDEAIEIIRSRADHQMMQMAGLDEDEDLFAPIVPSAKRRLFWLGINLVTAFLAAAVIGIFEDTLQQLVALAVLMPIVASMGGIAGSQTLTLAIRGLALGQISSANMRFLAIKEVAIAGINGAVWAVVVGVIAYLWFGQMQLAMVLGIAMVINQFAASVSGLSVPIVLDKMGIDPALSGAVILTTVTDVVGFMSFLGLATLLLL
jgi:magnesium transporter